MNRAHLVPVESGPPMKINDTGLSVPVATESVLAPDEAEPAVYLLGAHGGAGVSTLAHCLAPMKETDVFPAADNPSFVAVVAAAHFTGIDNAHRVIRQLQAGRAGGCTLVGLVVVNLVPGRMPKPVAQRLAAVADNVAEVWQIPFVDQWRSVGLADLPTWSPDMDQPAQGRKRRRAGPLEEVPAEICEVGLDLCRSAVDLYKSLG